MKLADAIKQWETGAIVVRGIYHGGVAKTQTVRSAQAGGARREATVTRETVLTELDAIVLSAWMPDGQGVADFKPACAKGKPCIIIVESMTVENGNRVVNRGRIEPLEG